MVRKLNPTPKNYRWRIVALLFFATTINYIDRQVIGILKPFIAGALGGALSAAFVGLLLEFTGSYFFIFLLAASVYMVNWLILKFFIREMKPVEIEKI